MKEFDVGTVVEMKKAHPCGTNEWEIIRMGADIKIKCLKCQRIIMLPRNKFERNVKKILR